LANQITKYHEKYPDEPINLFGHSNGTIVILLALRQITFKVDNVVLAASPLDTTSKRNIDWLKAIAINNTRAIHFHYSEKDPVTHNPLINGSRKMENLGNAPIYQWNWTKNDPGTQILLRIDAHNNFLETTGPWFGRYVKQLAQMEPTKKPCD
jgi:hypothetical protein